MHAATLNNSAYAQMIAFGKMRNGAPNTLNENVIKKKTTVTRIQYSMTDTTSTSIHRSRQ